MINAARLPRDIITIGASAGGVEALVSLLEGLPATLPASLAVVLHRSPNGTGYQTRLPQVLGRRSALLVMEPEEGEPLVRGAAYIAPRDHHMVLADHSLSLNRGPKEHRTRPAIDPLFRSAAVLYGPRVVGVLLSGMGADGVSGLIAIKAHGGLSLVQCPGQAAFPSMPQHAIAEDDVDAILDVETLAETLTALARGEAIEDLARTERDPTRR